MAALALSENAQPTKWVCMPSAVETSWEIIDPFVRAWGSGEMPPIDLYEPGNWGPTSSDAWINAQGRSWFDICPVL